MLRRLLVLTALLALPTLAQAQVGEVGPATVWYSRGNTFTAPVLFADGTAALPAIARSADPTTGIYFGSNSVLFSTAGALKGYFAGTEFFLNTTVRLNISGPGIQGGKSKALTDAAAATPYVTVAVPTDGWIGGELIWMATSVSTPDQLTAEGRIRFAGATTGGTPVCTVNVIGTDLQAVSGGANTLVCTWTNVVSGQTCALSVTCTNNLAGTQAITLYGRLDMPVTTTATVFP